VQSAVIVVVRVAQHKHPWSTGLHRENYLTKLFCRLKGDGRADGASRDTQCRKEKHRSTPKHSPGSPPCQSPTNWRMERRGALNVEEISTAQRRNTPQGVHPASHLRTGGWGVEGHSGVEETKHCSTPEHSPGSPSCQSPTNWRMGHRGALYVEED
jgi:hypothetical protein